MSKFIKFMMALDSLELCDLMKLIDKHTVHGITNKIKSNYTKYLVGVSIKK